MKYHCFLLKHEDLILWGFNSLTKINKWIKKFVP